jgi:hypothetical protein
MKLNGASTARAKQGFKEPPVLNMNCLQETLRRLRDQFYSDQWLSNCFSTSFRSDIPPGTDKFCLLSQADPFLSGIRIVIGLGLCLGAYSQPYKRSTTFKPPQNNLTKTISQNLSIE